MWLNSDTLEKSYVRNIHCNLKFRVWNCGSKWAYAWACKCHHCFSWCKLNLKHGNQHSSQGRDFTKFINVFRSETVALLTATSIHRIRKSTRKQKLRNKMEGNRRLKDREIAMINKEVRRKEKKRCSIEVDSYIMWK